MNAVVMVALVSFTTVHAFAIPTPRHTTSTAVGTNQKHVESISSTAISAVSVGQYAMASLLPASLGLWRTGYAVSYGYGGAMLSTGLLHLLSNAGNLSKLQQCHVALYALYGMRLVGFLLHREIKLPVEIHKMARRPASLLQRMKRLPVIIGCSVLYACMSAGPMQTLALTTTSTTSSTVSNITNTLLLLIGLGGFALGAVGDWYKCKVKARDGPQTLVTTGPFAIFRHPNYTGEMIGWTCTCLLLPLLNVVASGSCIRRKVIPWLLSSIVGWAGIVFAVLIGEATIGLEQQQFETYGGTPEYEKWIQTSWSGPMLGKQVTRNP